MIQNNIFIIYEVGQVRELQNIFRDRSGQMEESLVLALSLDVEHVLEEADIPFISAEKYRRVDAGQLALEDRQMREFFGQLGWTDFRYMGVELPPVFRFMFQVYLQRISYYANLLIGFFDDHRDIKSVKLFPPSETITGTYGALAYREIHAVPDCVRAIADVRGLYFEIIPLSIVATVVRSSLRPIAFAVKRKIFGLILTIWNSAIRVIRRPSHPRLIISDYWKNVSASLGRMDQGEFIFLDRLEMTKIGWKQLFKYRMRFVHILDYLGRSERREIREQVEAFGKKWEAMRQRLPDIFIWKSMSFDRLFHQAIADVISNFKKILGEIKGSQAMYDVLKPDLVHVRASVSLQTHFAILCLVADKRGIPAVELQHGLEYLGPGSFSQDHSAKNIAVYGQLIKKEFLRIGYDPDRIKEIGSPRFDGYLEASRKAAQKDERFTVLCIAPDIRAFEIYDTYSARNYFREVGRAIGRNQDFRLIIKLRPGLAHEKLYFRLIDEELRNIPHEIARFEPLQEIFPKADAVISCFSTSVLEALQFGLPVILPSIHPVDREVNRFHFRQYEDDAPIHLAYSAEEIGRVLAEIRSHPERREEIAGRARSFLSKNFAFDGQSSKRYSEMVRDLSMAQGAPDARAAAN